MVLENIIREGFSEEVTFKEDLKGEKSWEKKVLGWRNSRCQGLGVGHCLGPVIFIFVSLPKVLVLLG